MIKHIIIVSFFVWIQQIPPPPPPGGSELWSGTTVTDINGGSVSNGDWNKSQLEAALYNNIPLPGGWVGYFNIMAALESNLIDPNSLQKKEWRLLVNYTRNLLQNVDEQRRVCDLAELSLGETPGRCGNLLKLPISKKINTLLILSFLILFVAYPYRDRFFLFK